MSDDLSCKELMRIQREDYEARIHELEAELETCRKYRDAYRQCDEIATADVRRLQAENARLTATVEAYEHMKAQMDADGGPGVLRRQMELRNYKVRAEKAEAERDEAINQLDSCRHTNDVWERRTANLRAEVEKLRGDLMSARDCAVQAENERDDAKAEVERLRNPPEDHCAKCGAPRSNHPYRHRFVPRALAETEED